MYTKILAAFDNSPRGDRVFEAALSLAKANQASLMLLHVLSRDSDDSPVRFSSKLNSRDEDIYRVYRREWEDFVQKMDERLTALMQIAATETVMAEFKQLEGSPGKTICDFARNWGADLIVIGRRGYSSESEMFIGSVSSYIIHRCNCSVHIVQQ
ncbi:universal stress protein [Altericista sp. CCNU0014]|uniref:universal stress protein n=1 Tax=Altericista sp. CCNU0014 TaxID=3082949 RepID=UPI0038501BEE